MTFYTRQITVRANTETSLGLGNGASITIGAATSGVLPTGAATVTAGGTGFPVSRTLNVFFTGSGAGTAKGTVTTNSSGVITAAAVTNGGGGYTNGSSAAFAISGADFAYQTPMYLDASNNILVGDDFQFQLRATEKERTRLRAFAGGRELIRGGRWVEFSFTTDLAPVGAGRPTVPPWDPLALCLGMARSWTTTGATVNKIDYTLVSDNYPSCYFQVMSGGLMYSVKGVRAKSLEATMMVNGICEGKWEMVGFLDGDPVAASLGTSTMTAWKTPGIITDDNSGDIVFGATYDTTNGTLTGGTRYPSSGLKFKIDNTNAKARFFLGGNTVATGRRDTTGEIACDLTAAQRLDFIQKWSTSTLESLGFQIGLTAGNSIRIWAPATERGDPENFDDDELLLTMQKFRCRPTTALGNDEFRIVLGN